MNKNHFFFGYAGNKRNEFNNAYEEFKKVKDITTIYEPFCGTSAFSYFLSVKEPKKYKYILNDNNKQLIELYKTAQDEKKLNTLITTINNLMVDIDKEKYLVIVKQDTLEGFVIKYKYYTISPGLFPLNKKINKDFSYMENCPIINFLRNENITFTNETVGAIKDEYNNNETFIFLDPPYLTECNDFYSDSSANDFYSYSSANIYEYVSNNCINNLKCEILMILSDNWIIRLLFKKYIKNTYKKQYQCSKKKINHVLITNF